MSAAFTPGPWEYGIASNYDGFYVSPQGRLPTLAACTVHNFPQQTEANARLIAAAPELYEAVEALVECFIKRGPFDEPLGESEQAPSINAGIAALAKARGDQ